MAQSLPPDPHRPPRRTLYMETTHPVSSKKWPSLNMILSEVSPRTTHLPVRSIVRTWTAADRSDTPRVAAAANVPCRRQAECGTPLLESPREVEPSPLSAECFPDARNLRNSRQNASIVTTDRTASLDKLMTDFGGIPGFYHQLFKLSSTTATGATPHWKCAPPSNTRESTTTPQLSHH